MAAFKAFLGHLSQSDCLSVRRRQALHSGKTTFMFLSLKDAGTSFFMLLKVSSDEVSNVNELPGTLRTLPHVGLHGACLLNEQTKEVFPFSSTLLPRMH